MCPLNATGWLVQATTLLEITIRLSTTQVSSSFKWLDTRTSTSPTPVLNDCYSEVTAYIVLAYSYSAGFHDAYACLCHAH